MTAITTLCQCGSGLPVDDDDQCIVCWFDQFRSTAPRTLHPHASDLRSTAHIATASVNGRARLAARDAAREAAHGYDPIAEIRQDCEDDLVPVRCECGRVYRMDGVPHPTWVCPECECD